MKKKITKTGVAGTFEGLVRITMNYKTIQKEVYNPILHDEETRNVPVHKVEAFEIVIQPLTTQTMLGAMNSSVTKQVLWRCIDEIQSEKMVEEKADLMEKEITAHLEFKANHIPEKSFAQKMSEKGYEE